MFIRKLFLKINPLSVSVDAVGAPCRAGLGGGAAAGEKAGQSTASGAPATKVGALLRCLCAGRGWSLLVGLGGTLQVRKKSILNGIK